MSDQLALAETGPATPPDLKLTRRQRFALEVIARRPPTSTELGAALHEYRALEGGRGHGADETCQFCKPEGAHMGATLRTKKLVRFARGLGVWYVESDGKPRATQNDAYGDIPF